MSNGNAINSAAMTNCIVDYEDHVSEEGDKKTKEMAGNIRRQQNFTSTTKRRVVEAKVIYLSLSVLAVRVR